MTPFIRFTPAVLKRIYDNNKHWRYPVRGRYFDYDPIGLDAQLDKIQFSQQWSEEIKKAIDQYNHISPSNEMKDTTPSST